ncbi:integrin alpha-4-like isoform X2 [Mytilus californianus]|uniref:integrin alpha-4-like isoform X2 n=1 Tax=Mytilus californianus TaxID=6549 RepID=UPI002247F5B5|nr:integrin alpha-4-like isoform X2 [Mytilus californianus]
MINADSTAMDFMVFIFKTYICLHYLDSITHAYNFDKKNVMLFKGPKGSYFGYSVGILENKNGIMILVGAPKGNSSNFSLIDRPGLLYKCPIAGQKRDCYPVNVNNAGNTEETISYHNKRITFHNDMSNQWLGMTLDIEPINHSSIMICAPRWKDSYLEKKMNGMSHMNGICYLLSSDLSSPPKFLPALTNLKRLVNRKSNYVEFSMGAMGFSAVFSQENGTLLFGAPGLNDWTGGVVIETIAGENNVRYIEPSRKDFQDSYSGYSITTGKFVSRNKFSIAVGAPRADNYGKVLLYSSESTVGPLSSVVGTQTGSYFGAALCSLSIEGDKLDYLVVGAPMFADKSPEEGRVFVFKSHGLLGFRKASVLRGLDKPFARFGATISNIGDLDKDGFEDIVVGAPYEEDGRGSIYIFNGYKLGLWSKFTKHITAREIDPGIRTFGISFSRPYDVDRNNYSDIAVGAYKSGHTIVLWSTPLIDLSETILKIKNLQPVNGCIIHEKLQPNCTNQNLLQGNMIYCFMFKSDRLNSPTNAIVKYQVVFDSSRNNSRVFGYNKSNKLIPLKTFTGKRRIYVNRRACENTTIYIQFTEESNQDVWIELDYNLRGRKVTLLQFNGKKKQPEITNKSKAKVELKQKCADDNECDEKILIKAAMEIQNENQTVYTVGKSVNVLVLVTVLNMDDIKTSSDVSINIQYSKILSFVKSFHYWSNRSLPCDIEDYNSSKFIISCRISKEQNYNTSAIFEFYVGNGLLEDSVEFLISSHSSSRISNNVTLYLPVVSRSHVIVIGKGSPDEVILKLQNESIKTEHEIVFTYIIFNEGPSTLENSSMFISYPELPGVLDMNGLMIESNPKDSSKYMCTLKMRGEISSTLVDKINKEQNIQLICNGVHPYCTNIVCKFRNIGPRTSVTLNINMLLTVHGNKFQQLRHVKLQSTSVYRNKTEEKDWDEIILFTKSNRKSKVIIDVFNVDMNYEEVRDMQMWIIIVSGAGGIVVFLIISLFMFKVGFFRRLDNEDLQLRKANWKLRIAEANQDQDINRTRQHFHRRNRHTINNACFSSNVDDDETHVLIPYSNDSITGPSDEDISSISSDMSEESGYLEPIKTRKQRVFVK